ncbi:MAG: response regulator [Deltaproteobacteria bacterium]|nr:response regulator [Deltaproteobacteria bacterium]
MKKKKILIADDDHECRALLKEVLVPDFDILEASDGHEAVNMLNGRNVDLMISDLKMPVQDGMDTILEARHLQPRLKIVIVSGYQEDIRRMKLFKADYAFEKPFDVLEVSAKIRQILSD